MRESAGRHGDPIAATVVISAAGQGRRLGLGMPKCLVKVGSRSLIEWQLMALGGVDVIVVVGFMADDVIAHVRNLRPDVRFAFNPDYQSTGTAASLAIGARMAAGPVVSLDGDLLVAEDDLHQFISGPAPSLVGLTEMSSTTAVGATFEDDQVLELGFEITSPWEWSGLLRMPAHILASFGTGHVFESLIPQLPIPAVVIDCVEIDEPEDVARANAWVEDHRVRPTGPALDKGVISAFWKQRAATGRTRWTDDAFMEFDRELIAPLIGPKAALLDLGSGFGELSRSLCPRDGTLTAVDQEAGFASGFSGDPRFRFERSDVVDFTTVDRFDVVLVFGVVTHLGREEELRLYEGLRDLLRPDGVVVVKNQCADGVSFEVDTYSDDLESRYIGRYPGISEQGAALHRVFAEVDIVRYPDRLKVHSDSSHVAFVCRVPR